VTLALQNQELSAEVERLRAEVEALRTQPKGAGGPPQSGSDFFDPPQEELLKMAAQCELRWDNPPLGSTPPEVSRKRVEELGMNETEIAAINKVYERNHWRTLRQLRQLYIEVTGEAKTADALSPPALASEVMDKMREDEQKVVFQRLARERAGLQPPPADLSGTSPGERLYRLLTTMGDRVEAEIGAEIGPDLARRYRELKGGFGSRSRSRNGCP
jgi:hypothetical protein